MISILQTIWFLFSHGGWVLFVILGVYILFKFYVNEIQSAYKDTIQWTFLEIKPPKENIASFYNAEQIYIQLHQLFDSWTPQEKYLEGKILFWLSFEIVSLGGTISFIIRVPTKHRELVEASFYANYQHIEISEVKDYLSNFDYNPDDDKYEMFGNEFVLTQNHSLPIRTYREFISLKGPDASEKVVDPLNPLLEVFSRVTPHEFYALQILIRPAGDASWKSDADKMVEKLTGDKEFQQIDDITRLQIAAIKTKLGKPAYETKIRFLHIGPTEVFNPDSKKLVMSPMKIFSSANFNGFKPAFSPKLNYRISKTLEAPFIDPWVRKRKIAIFEAFKARSTWVGEAMYILNVEELATLYHFPVTAENAIPSVETVDVKKIQPPSNLPV